jgi:hypothetical protein
MDETKAVCEVCGREVSWRGWIRNGTVCGGAIDNEALAECYRLGYERMRALASPSESAPQPTPPSKDQIEYMVQRFLNWRLPENFSPDAGISFKATFNDHMPFGPMKHNPVGTNLFDANQATAMVRYMLDGMPAPAPQPTPEPAAAPPSAPQEGLRPREIAFQKKAQERAVLAHKPKLKTDTRPRCTATTRRGFPCQHGQHIDGLCLMHAAGMWHRYVKQQATAVSDGERLANSLRAVRAIAGRALGAGEFPMRKESEVEQGHAHTFDAQLLCTICGQCAFDLAEAALPLPESALPTKAAPLAGAPTLTDAERAVAGDFVAFQRMCNPAGGVSLKPDPAAPAPMETRLTEEEK